MSEARTIQLDRMRFTKNSASSRLAILAIVFDVLFFISIYKSNVDNYYYNILMGGSIIYNLVFLLATFLASEGTKNYKRSYSWLLIVIGVIQFLRILVYPMSAHQAVADSGELVMGNAQFIRVIIYLVASGVCCIASAIINLKKSAQLEAHVASLKAKA